MLRRLTSSIDYLFVSSYSKKTVSYIANGESRLLAFLCGFDVHFNTPLSLSLYFRSALEHYRFEHIYAAGV